MTTVTVEVKGPGLSDAHDITVPFERPVAEPSPPNLDLALVELNTVTSAPGWLTGPVPPTVTGNQIGQMYLGDDGSIWQWNGAEWIDTGVNIHGSPDTPEEILAKLLTVDGAGSLLDADMLDGFHASHFATDADLDAFVTAVNGTFSTIAADQADQDAEILLRAPIASPVFTGNPQAPTPATGDDDTSIATTAFVNASIDAYDAPNDTDAYGRKAGAWVDVTEEAPEDGLPYARKDGAWTPSIGGASTDLLPPPGPLLDGQFWWKSDTGILYLWYDDGTGSGQWVQAAGSTVIDKTTAEEDNRVRNGAMRISQEWAKGTNLSASLAFPADMWKVAYATTAGVGFSCFNATASDTDIVSYIRLNTSTADASLGSTDFYGGLNVIEGVDTKDFYWGTPNAKQAVLQFKARGAIAGTFAVSVRNFAGTRCFSKNFTLAAVNTWEDFELVIPPDLAGTWVDGEAGSVIVAFYIMLGSSFLGPEGWNSSQVLGQAGITNWAAVAGQWFDFANVGLHRDPKNTGKAPPFVIGGYDDELIRCRRYWQRYPGMVVETSSLSQSFTLPVRMRAAPTITGGGAGFTFAQAHTDVVQFYQTARAYQTLTFDARM